MISDNPRLIRIKWRKAGLLKEELEPEPHDNSANLTIFSDSKLSD